VRVEGGEISSSLRIAAVAAVSVVAEVAGVVLALLGVISVGGGDVGGLG
jgi:hypothetical protein